MESMVINESDVMASQPFKTNVNLVSGDAQRVEFGDRLAQCRLDADVQRHMRARAPGAHPRQPDRRRIPLHSDQFDIAPVSVEVRAHPIEHSLNAFLGNHEWLPLKAVKSPDRLGPDIPDRATEMPAADMTGFRWILAGFRQGARGGTEQKTGTISQDWGKFPSGSDAARFFELELLDSVPNLVPIQTQERSGARLVPSRPFERLDKQRPFELLEIDAGGW